MSKGSKCIFLGMLDYYWIVIYLHTNSVNKLGYISISNGSNTNIAKKKPGGQMDWNSTKIRTISVIIYLFNQP